MAYIKKLPSGHFQAQIRLKGLKPIVKTFTTKQRAKAFARQVEGDTEMARKLGLPTTHTIGFDQCVQLYLAQATLKDHAAQGRLTFWRQYFGDQPLHTIDAYQVDAALHQLAKTRSGSTVNRYKSHLSAIFIFAIRDPQLKRYELTNPVVAASVSRFKENPAKDRFLSPDEQVRLLQAAKEARWPKLYVLILMALTTGARKGELLNLRWKDIDAQNRLAFLAQTKTDKPRYIPLTEPVITQLEMFRAEQYKRVFENTVGNNKPYDIKQAWQYALKRAKITPCRFHDLRHTAASNLVRAGRTLFEVATLLGHSSPQMTQRYAHLATADTQRMVEAVMGKLR